jgi:hypothetical protein
MTLYIGKTTIARRMGQMFYSLGLLPSAKVIEKSASDMASDYAGQAGKVTLDVLTKARGKVLFIDEAYRLNPQKGGHARGLGRDRAAIDIRRIQRTYRGDLSRL